MSYYILNERGEPVPCPDIIGWSQWYWSALKSGAHILRVDKLDDGVIVSTVFLGIDPSYPWVGGAGPILWETKIFGGRHGGYEERYVSRDEAWEGHERALTFVRE